MNTKTIPIEPAHSIGRRRLLGAAAATVAGVGSMVRHARAATFPSKVVKLVVPFAASGGTDIIARLLSPQLQEMWGQSVIVENVTGASGIIGAQKVQRAAPDGHTLLVTITNTHAILPHLQPLPFDPFKDFTAVSNLANGQTGIFVRADLPVKDLPGLFEYARKLGGPLNFGDWGIGSLAEIIGASLAIDQGFKVVPVHYRGVPPIILAALSGEISAGLADLASVLPHHKTGKLRLLALTGASRNPTAPHIPLFSDYGIRDFEFYPWIGVFAPANTPLALRKQIAQDLQTVLLRSPVRENVVERGFLPAVSSPEQFELEWRSAYETYGRLIQKTGVGLKS